MVVTLAFAISWLPIHTLELMKCAQSSLLNKLIASYPKVLYTIRALTHALAYFNSCLNPYLYALLNRNFCFDLIDIIPSCLTCIKTKEFVKKRRSNVNTKLASLPADILLTKIRPDEYDDDDEEDDHLLRYDTAKPTNIDASCQVELLWTSPHWFILDCIFRMLYVWTRQQRLSFSFIDQPFRLVSHRLVKKWRPESNSLLLTWSFIY